MQIDELVLSISTHRLSTYKRLFNEIVYEPSKYDEHSKVLFYLEIQSIYSHFFIPMQTLEIVLRNRIHHFQSEHWGTSSWFKKLIAENCATDPTKNAFATAKKNIVKDLKDKGISDRGPYPSDFVGKLNFGFWVELLQVDYRSTSFWQFYGLKVFPNKQKVKLGEMYDLLHRIQGVRNRLYHYEPLWDTTKGFKHITDFCNTLEDTYYLIIRLIGYLSLEHKEQLEDHIFFFNLEIKDFEKKYQKP